MEQEGSELQVRKDTMVCCAVTTAAVAICYRILLLTPKVIISGRGLPALPLYNTRRELTPALVTSEKFS
jgi:hypothetical protein